MKNSFLLIAATALLVTLGFGQTSTQSSTTSQASIKGCLGGSDGNYTVAEDGTTQTYKITSSTVDLKPHVGHDIEVTGQTTTATSSRPYDNSVAVTEMSMISDHCAAATVSAYPAAAVTPAVADTTSTATTSTPVVADTTIATASTPPATDTTPVATASTPVAADPTPTRTSTDPDNTNSNQLPNTATPLPLLALLGLGLLGLGLLTTSLLKRRSRAN
jgi:hypothetical protein